MDEPLTVAVNWLIWETVSDVTAGVTDTLIGVNVMLALANLLGSAALVAVTVTDCALEIDAGAV